jgi:uncharacterized protein YacL
MPIGRQEIYALFFAVIVGVFAAMILDFALDAVPSRERGWMGLLVGLGVTYLVFRFRTRATVELRPVPVFVLDTSALIDGRIADVVGLGFLPGRLVVPPYVVGELQHLADSADKQRRTRGRRGLDVLDRLRSMPAARLTLDVVEKAGGVDNAVDRRLVALSKELDARLVTQDFNLNKVAKVHGVEVVNLNELSTALRPVCLPGERMELQLVKPGEHAGQAVGYLDDGTMVVVEAGREHLGRRAAVLVTSVTQTSAGRMVFARFEQSVDAAPQPA